MSHDANFEFIQQNPNVVLSKETRTKIRKHVMRGVGDARRRTTRAINQSSKGGALRQPLYLFPNPVAPLPLSGLELLVKDKGLDPMDLSALTSIHVGGIASKLLYSDPGQLSGVLLCRQSSYFSFIPARFGSSSALDDAFHCLITQTHSILVPTHKANADLALSRYGKALHSLQSAVDDPQLQSSSEAICASAILAVFEILHSPYNNSWFHHITGAARLIQARGPSQFTSDFDKALFIALAYPISKTALLNNQKCFLEDPAWTAVFESCVCPGETFTDRSELGISLLIILSKIPTLAKRTTHAIVFQELFALSHFEAISSDLRIVRTSILIWRRRFNTTLINAEDRSRDDTADFGKRYELFGVSLVVNILLDRMLHYVSPKERAVLEEEVQNLALEIKTVRESLKHNNRASFFLAQKSLVADAAIVTHRYFLEVLDSGKIIEAWRLKKFCESLGRKCCDGNNCCQED